MKYGIVVIAYNRTNTIQRLLNGLNNADYQGDDVMLIISIDKSENLKVQEVAHQFEWNYGRKIVLCQEQNLGLRTHILKCGSYIEEYGLDAMAVFEDDTYPSPAFYNYMKQAVECYNEDDNIAGISLYSHAFNMNVHLPFQPDNNGYDTYFLQYAQSWGQVWMRKQWKEFIDWYQENQGDLSERTDLPKRVRNWPKSSWLKYHTAYCVSRSKYFVYPYVSLVTCYNEVGTHASKRTTQYHVPMMKNANKKYLFPDLKQDLVSYDVFFEREQVANYLNISKEELCIDIYGSRESIDKRFLISSKKYPYKIIKSYAFELYPQEENIKENIAGKDIRLYDTADAEVVKSEGTNSKFDWVEYYYKFFIGKKNLMKYLWKKWKG